jgi:hypothetical protein
MSLSEFDFPAAEETADSTTSETDSVVSDDNESDEHTGRCENPLHLHPEPPDEPEMDTPIPWKAAPKRKEPLRSTELTRHGYVAACEKVGSEISKFLRYDHLLMVLN